MGLIKARIGDIIQLIDIRNVDLKYSTVYGLDINKSFIPTLANLSNVNLGNYKIVEKGRFVFSGMQTGRDENIRIALYENDEPALISPAYSMFKVRDLNIVLSEYFFMIFLSKEMDRLGWFLSDSSVRANLDWDRFCDIELNLPSIEIQQKYVNIYKAMVANQKAYEKGLDDLKLTCDAYIENLKHATPRKTVGKLLKEVDVRNSDNAISNVQGINVDKMFMPSNLKSSDISKYKVIKKGQFAYSSMQTGRDEVIRIALYSEDEPCVISPAYSVLEITTPEINPEFVMMWFSRKESDRYGWFISDSSVRANLDLSEFYQIKIPVPEISVQNSIIDIYNVYLLRREMNEILKRQIKEICPILIKGSLEETK